MEHKVLSTGKNKKLFQEKSFHVLNQVKTCFSLHV